MKKGWPSQRAKPEKKTKGRGAGLYVFIWGEYGNAGGAGRAAQRQGPGADSETRIEQAFKPGRRVKILRPYKIFVRGV